MSFCNESCICCNSLGIVPVNLAGYHKICMEHCKEIIFNDKICQINCRHCKSIIVITYSLCDYCKKYPKIKVYDACKHSVCQDCVSESCQLCNLLAKMCRKCNLYSNNNKSYACSHILC